MNEYEDDLNNDESLNVERNLNVNSVNTIGAANNQYEGFGDGTDAIKTEEGLYKIMERDGGIKLKMD